MWHVNTHLGIYKVSTVHKILALVPEQSRDKMPLYFKTITAVIKALRVLVGTAALKRSNREVVS